MKKMPHILHIIYKNGTKGRLNLSAQTSEQRQQKLNDWAQSSGVRTAFLAWK